MNRKQPFKAVGVLAAILISPRNFLYTNCAVCEISLYYTYAGEECPFCGTVVEDFQQGVLPKARVEGSSNGNGRRPRRRRGRNRSATVSDQMTGEATDEVPCGAGAGSRIGD
jgi:hypothetical protein